MADEMFTHIRVVLEKHCFFSFSFPIEWCNDFVCTFVTKTYQTHISAYIARRFVL